MARPEHGNGRRWPWWLLAGALLLALVARLLLQTPARGPAPTGVAPLEPAPAPRQEVAPAASREPAHEPRAEAPLPAPAPSGVGRLTVQLRRGPGGQLGLEGAVVALETSGERRKRVEHADASGTCVFTGLAARTWTLTAYQSGLRPLEREFVSDGSEQTLELVLDELWRVELYLLTPAGEPLAPALRAAGLELPQPFAASARPGPRWREAQGVGAERLGVGNWFGDGPFHDDSQPGRFGALVIEAAPPVFAGLTLGEHVLFTEELGGTETSVRWTVDPEEYAALHARVRGRIVSGAALSGSVAAGDPYGSTTSAERVVGADGSFELRLPPGEYRLYFAFEGAPPWSELVHLAPRETLELGERSLDDSPRRSARVLGPDGEPLEAHFRIGVVRGESREIDWTSYHWLQSLPDGHLELPTLGSQPLFLLGSVPRGAESLAAPLVELGTRAEPRSVSELSLVRAAPLTFRGPGLPPDATVELCTQPAGWRFSVARLGVRYAGRYAPGEYLALVRDASGVELLRRPFTLGPEGLELVF